jgi:AcrR family transcriptional regulator
MSEEISKKEAILKSALEIFVTKGFDNTSTTAITKYAGVGTGTLFIHFKTKEELINVLYLNIKKERMETFLKIANEEMITEDSMKEIFISMVKWGVDNPDKMRFMRQYSSSPYITNITKDQQNAEVTVLVKQIRRSIDKGILKDIPIDLMLNATNSIINTVVFYFIENDGYDEEQANSYFSLVWDLIKK